MSAHDMMSVMAYRIRQDASIAVRPKEAMGLPAYLRVEALQRVDVKLRWGKPGNVVDAIVQHSCN